MNLVESQRHQLRIEWLKLNRSELCPDCNGMPFPKRNWDYTRWCPGCKQIWRTLKDKWSFEA